ncbi:hypothetical protein GUITHDRAFT_139385 [Guillardia theta CCMP2712]|uniref:IPT/TIG domain-containing protein n=1 Tax=Guillardia theta (strain CCMP2712) TaxID=905079 RepID=L1JAJ9_GUITC|nr:hypothetical protein GUITHDRAFT_139385 [Guillardia theta CCMP2712]EKX45129.1 hypothetical protein GUITHDRAFT_139385 [Guillardia theta CCMP2712]|eukprot:XP_005832109.1 hypothetical protein GUITHDRAFT_139385 [Guillardia theta CCMP2712]
MTASHFTNMSNWTNLTRVQLSIFGWFDGYDSSATIRTGSSACEASMWTSSTALACRMADGVGGSLRIGVTVGEIVGTRTEAVTYSVPHLRPALEQGPPGPAVGGGEVRLEGYGIGVADMSAMGRVWISSCEGTEWVSDSMVACKQAQGIGKELRVSVTSGSLVGTVAAGAAYAAPSVLYGSCSHAARDTCSVNYTQCVESNSTGEGRCACEVSFADCLGKQGCADHSRLLAFQSTCPQNWTLYSGHLTLSDLANASLVSNRAGSGKRPAVTIHGMDFGEAGYTIAGRAGVSACEATSWTSDSAVACSRAPGKGSSMAITVTVGEQVDTTMTSHSFDHAEISSGRGVNVAGSGSMWTWIAGTGLGIWDLSLRGRLGGSESEATTWTSDSAITCQAGIGTRGSHLISISVMQESSTLSEAVSYNSPVLNLSAVVTSLAETVEEGFMWPGSLMNTPASSNGTFLVGNVSNGTYLNMTASHFTNMSNWTNLTRVQLSIFGWFDGYDSSATIRTGSSACEASMWTSSTALACRMADGVGGSLRIGVTVGEIVGTRTEAVTYSVPHLRPALEQGPPGPAVGGGEVRLEGYGIGVADMSAMGRVWISSCEGTEWVSDSMVACKQAQGIGKELRVSVTSGSLVGTVAAGAAYAAPSVLYGSCSHAARDTCSVNYTQCVESNSTGEGRCACEVSFADCLGKQGCADHSRLLAFQSTCPQNWTLYSGHLTLSDLANASLVSNRAGSGKRPAVTIHGMDFGEAGYTIAGRAGVSACEATSWTSDSAVACSRAPGKGSSMAITVTVGEQVDTTMTSHSFDHAEISSGRGVNVAGSGSMWTWIAGTGLGIWDLSLRGRLGGSESEATTWTSDSAITSRCVAGGMGSHVIAITVLKE